MPVGSPSRTTYYPLLAAPLPAHLPHLPPLPRRVPPAYPATHLYAYHTHAPLPAPCRAARYHTPVLDGGSPLPGVAFLPAYGTEPAKRNAALRGVRYRRAFRVHACRLFYGLRLTVYVTFATARHLPPQRMAPAASTRSSRHFLYLLPTFCPYSTGYCAPIDSSRFTHLYRY